ncbi:hypothetical protein C3007_07230 [Avibacterium gallinarum]|uniref:Uncharacterized protein DUF2513 n=1 Tax=Avibacterium gallinarum TaxID=755 RepID=A0A379B0W9_AVIGA|nr:DUF2513 domain-containing protein [Avibacterium gallinarum]POY44102.1 hypothetical protein C3007_07230 [Avibacterium gallinarum]TDP29094.1 uncharacterized protein DUF2513 [Avibacterium gallinarum]SUB28509.1 Uncharacterised protein [Avibacterium gallinarum]
MKRNWELIRKILFKLALTSLDNGGIKGFPPAVVEYHYLLLKQSQLIDSQHKLTWQGHEFLDKIRNDTAWNKIKQTIKTKGIDLSFEAIKLAGKSLLFSLLK